MNFHEYQAKQLFADYGIAVPPGRVARTPEEAVEAAKAIGGDLLDIHAAFGGGDEGDRLGAAVDQHRQVQLLVDVGTFGDQHGVDRKLHAGGLVGRHPGAEHRRGVLLHFIKVLRQLDAAGLAAAAGVDLRLDHPQVARDVLGGCDGFFRSARHAPGRYGNAVVGKELLCLVFVKIHASSEGS